MRLLSGWQNFINKLNAEIDKFDNLRELIENNLKSRSERLVDRSNINGELTEAAVLMPLLVSKEVWDGAHFEGLITDHIYLLLEKRSSQMNKNPGDMAFAGGKVDNEDHDLLTTAYREAQEEVGIEEKSLNYIACMDEFVSTSNYVVRTVVSWLIIDDLEIIGSNNFREACTAQYFPRTNETEHTVVVPLTHLLDPMNYSNVKYELRTGLSKSTYGYLRYFDIHEFLEKTKIWGLTASMIRRLIDIIFPDNPLPEEPNL